MKPKLLTEKRFVDKDIGCSYRYVLSDEEYFRPHYHEYYEIFIMLDGECIHMVNSAKMRLATGTVVLIRPDDMHDYICIDGKPFSMLNITFSKETADGIFAFLGSGFPSDLIKSMPLPPTVLLNHSELSRITARMNSINAISSHNKARLGTALRYFIFDITAKYFSDFSEDTSTVPAWLEELCEKCKQNGNFVYGTEKLFGMSDKSREHICRSFKKYLGITATEFINSLRLRYIANMLKNSNHSISDIVFSSGFNNLGWASYTFKKQYHTTMSEYRLTHSAK